MRHRKGLKKLNRTSSHRKAMFANMAESLLTHESIRTTLAKAKALRPYVEKIITKAKEKNLSTIRYLASIFHSNDTVKKLTDDIGQRVAKRQGGYTRIYKVGFRPGDTADMALIELIDKAALADVKAKAKTKATVKTENVSNDMQEVKELKKVVQKETKKTADKKTV
jgi:large subunit ribosomal protein L17